MDVESYDLLVLKTKQSLDTKVCRKAILASHLCTVLEECNRCVSLSLDLVVKILDGNIQFHKLCSYLEDAVTLIQMLSDFIKYVIESTAMGCCNMKPFPVTAGSIIFTVFLHCKDSEIIYGEHLKSVESQLKDLFRSCHELQLTYLMTMEKHFIFDLTEKDQQEILIEALDINMKIGEIVQALDVKTMAEQWKAFTVICEKYSNFLLNKNVYNKCTHLFIAIIKHNIKTALESEEDNKTLIRSLKVANFTIKLLLKVSNVFKHAATNNYENVVELLLYIYMRNQAYLECFLDKSKQFASIVHTNILIPTESLCNILLQDERFLDYIYKIHVSKLERNTFLGYIILLTSLMKVMLHWKEDQALLISKQKIIECVYRILPLGHYWFNNGLQFFIKDSSGLERCFGLYEYLLAHTVAFASTFNADLYAELEKYMYEAILSTDCYSAMFSSNLWVIIARMSSGGKLATNTLLSLINIYQRLKNHQLFPHSPQNVHLHYAIQKFFKIIPAEEMKQIYLENNVDGALKVCYLPNHLQKSAEAIALENLKTSFVEIFESREVNEKDFAKFIETIKIAATCSFKENIAEIEKCVVKMWSKACNGNMCIKMDMCITSGTVWYFQYLEAIIALTECIQYKFSSSYNVGKILHVMSTIMDSCTTDMIILIFDLFCTLSLNRREDENRDAIETNFKRSLNLLLQSVESDIQSLLLKKLSKYAKMELFRELTSTILYEGAFLRNEWEVYCDNDYKYSSEWRNNLMQSENYEFSHKCLRSDVCPESEPCMKTSQSNFDLGDFIFESSSSDSEEPSRKKAKLDLNETESLIGKLENDASLLCQINTTLSTDYRKRISDVINKLRNIIS